MLQPEISYFRRNELSSFSEPIIAPDKLRVATATHIYYIDIRDIVRIQSISNYSKLFFTSGQTLLVSKVLAYFEELLGGCHFSRVHRTHLVNLLYLKEYSQGDIPRIGLINNEVLPVSRRKKKLLQQKMRLLSLQH